MYTIGESRNEKDLSRLLYRICGSGLKTGVFSMPYNFNRSPPSNFTRNETFCEHKGLLKVFGTMRLTGDLHYTCDKQVLWESAGAFFSARQLSDFTRQLARFTRSWSSGKMLAFQPRGFVFEPVGMR